MLTKCKLFRSIFVFLLISTGFVYSTSQASGFLQVPIDKLMLQADTIVMGRVSSIRYRKDEKHGFAWTIASLEQPSVLTDTGMQPTSSNYEITYYGGNVSGVSRNGEVGPVYFEIAGAPRLEKDAIYLLFLTNNRSTHIPFTSGPESALKILKDGNTIATSDGQIVRGVDESGLFIKTSSGRIDQQKELKLDSVNSIGNRNESPDNILRRVFSISELINYMQGKNPPSRYIDGLQTILPK